MQHVAVQDPVGSASVELTDEDAPPTTAMPPMFEMAGTSRALPMFGPVGRRRSPWAVAALAVVTLGVASLAWYRRVNREMEEFDPQLHARPGRSTLAVAIPWLAGLLTSLAGAVLIVTARLGVGLPVSVHLASPGPYVLLAGLAAVPLLIAIVPFGIVSLVMTLERLRCVEEHAGVTGDRQVRPVKSSLLLYVPVVGGLIMVARMQTRLNEVWETFAPARYVSR